MAEYIEREPLLARLNKVHMDNRPFEAGVQFGVDHAISCVIEADAADVVPVVHGTWKSEATRKPFLQTLYACSKCGYLVDRVSNYCPNCGAKMDGDRHVE